MVYDEGMRCRSIAQFVFLLSVFVVLGVPVQAEDVCYGSRTVNQHRCATTTLPGEEVPPCSEWASTLPGTGCTKTGGSKDEAENNCASLCETVYGGACDAGYCISYGTIPTTTSGEEGTWTCNVQSFSAGCTDPPDCQAIATIANCNVSVDKTTCTEDQQTLVYGCWISEPDPTDPAFPTNTNAPGEPTNT